jgi:hypothetical protein
MNNTHLEPRIIFRITLYMWVHPSPVSHFDVDFGQMAHCSQHLIIMPVYCFVECWKRSAAIRCPWQCLVSKRNIATFSSTSRFLILFINWHSLNSKHKAIKSGGSIRNIWKHGTGWPFSMYVMYMAPRNGKLRYGILVFSLSSDESIALNKKKISSSSSSSLSSYAGTKRRLDPSIY